MEPEQTRPPFLIEKIIFWMVVVALAVAIDFIATADISWEWGS